MSIHDETALEHIEKLQSQLDAADIELDILRQEYATLRVEYDAMVKDRTYLPITFDVTSPIWHG